MKEIKILYIFPRLLSLYGEYGNVKFIEKYLKDNSFSVSVTEFEPPYSEDVKFSEYDFFYIGSGTEANLCIAAERLLPYRDEIQSVIEKDKVFLATGNSLTLFGQSIEMNGKSYPALKIFPHKTTLYTDRRYSGNALSDQINIFASVLIGYINTSAVYEGVEGALCKLLIGEDIGNDKKIPADGLLKNKFVFTQMIGPFLIKNPSAMRTVCQWITGEKLPLDMTSNQGLAYKQTLRALEEKLEQQKNK